MYHSTTVNNDKAVFAIDCSPVVVTDNNWLMIIIIIIIIRTIFMVLSSWQSHCKSSPGSYDECARRQAAADPQTRPNDPGCESACRLLEATPTIAIYYYY